MDIATPIGLLVCVGLIFTGMNGDSGVGIFWDAPSAMIVLGGCMGAMFYAFPAADVKTALKAAKTAVKPGKYDPAEMVKTLEDLSQRARREGLLSLEEAAEAAEDDFLKRGLQMMVDGHEPSAIESVLFGEIDKLEQRHKRAIGFWDTLGAFGPAMGMIGTLIGLVQMLQAMSDPSSIGPAMAIALITTFYGSLLANILAIPMANKLKQRSTEEIAFRELVAQGLISILGGENPRFMVERLNSTLPPSARVTEEAA